MLLDSLRLRDVRTRPGESIRRRGTRVCTYSPVKDSGPYHLHMDTEILKLAQYSYRRDQIFSPGTS